MFIGHLPAVYLGMKATAPKAGWSQAIMAGALVGSVAPDLDMVWFYLVDSSIHHHHFFTHRPLLWIAMAAVSAALRIYPLMALGLAAVVHCMLDSIVGSIQWLWPLSTSGFHLITVEATRSHWILSFLTHWTFAVEILITGAALFVVYKGRKT